MTEFEDTDDLNFFQVDQTLLQTNKRERENSLRDFEEELKETILEENRKKNENKVYEHNYKIHLNCSNEEGYIEDFIGNDFTLEEKKIKDPNDMFNFGLNQEKWIKLLNKSILMHYEKHLIEKAAYYKEMQSKKENDINGLNALKNSTNLNNVMNLPNTINATNMSSLNALLGGVNGMMEANIKNLACNPTLMNNLNSLKLMISSGKLPSNISGNPNIANIANLISNVGSVGNMDNKVDNTGNIKENEISIQNNNNSLDNNCNNHTITDDNNINKSNLIHENNNLDDNNNLPLNSDNDIKN